MAEKFQKRIRIFAGTNGFGKTTLVNQVRQVIVDGYPIDFGTVVNADEIADRLRRKSSLRFSDYVLPSVKPNLKRSTTFPTCLRDMQKKAIGQRPVSQRVVTLSPKRRSENVIIGP